MQELGRYRAVMAGAGGELIARRQAIPRDERRRSRALVVQLAPQHWLKLQDALLRGHGPSRVEIGPRPLVRRLVERRGAYASPPCFMHELAPSCPRLQPDREPRAASQAAETGNPRASGASRARKAGAG